MASWRDRECETQARSREENESTARRRAGQTIDQGAVIPFRCECGDGACTCAIRLTAAEYESVRAHATRFAIARNHENPECEQLVEEHERFAVVETVSAEAAKLARRSNPRQWHGQSSSADARAKKKQNLAGSAERASQADPMVGRCRRWFRSSTRLPTGWCGRSRFWRRLPRWHSGDG